MSNGDAETSWSDSSPGWDAVAREYARLEADLRAIIDPVAARVCPGCTRLCCRVCYCRATAQNPWYRQVNQVAGSFSVPPDWASRRDPFGLGAQGCEIRAGRYVYCYSYNCPALQRFVSERGAAAQFQEISDLLRTVNRLPGGRLLHEVRRRGELGEVDLRHLDRAVQAARQRLETLGPILAQCLGSS